MKFVVLSLHVGAFMGDEDREASSMLQTRTLDKTGVEMGSKMALSSKSLEILEANSSTQCSCAYNGCGTFACMPCPQMLCQCACAVEKVECPSCCNGDDACIKKKLLKVATGQLKLSEERDKYRIASANYKRHTVMEDRQDEDDDWKFDKKMREHTIKVRADQDKVWKDEKLSHKKLKKAGKARRQFFKKWKKDLSDEIANVKHMVDGGKVKPDFDITLPVCRCPPGPRCPPQQGCPRCPNYKCPPCAPCPTPRPSCDSCEEDAAIQMASNMMMIRKEFEVCPPMGSYCDHKDSWPEGCPAPRIGCPLGPKKCLCPKIYMPVCDDEGTQYPNGCVADCEGAGRTKVCGDEPTEMPILRR